MGAKGILPEDEIAKLFQEISENGAKLSYRTLPNGEKSVYEMCSTWWSALNKEDEEFAVALKKCITSHAIAFALTGVPAVYYLSLFGKKNDFTSWEKTLHNRDVNRENLDYKSIEASLSQQKSKEHLVSQSLVELIRMRTSHPAFHPNAAQTVLSLDNRVFSLLRKSPNETILALHNVSGDVVSINYEDKKYIVEPYGFLWEAIAS